MKEKGKKRFTADGNVILSHSTDTIKMWDEQKKKLSVRDAWARINTWLDQ